jgi:hypothetical protein
MPTYHQMGHQSEGLLTEPELSRYYGAIFSPVNYEYADMLAVTRRYRTMGNPEVIFDPQLYYPRTELIRLRSWSYFPSDYDTMDANTDAWWSQLGSNLVASVRTLQPDAICSPAIVPRTFTDDYYERTTFAASSLLQLSRQDGIDVLQTVIVSLDGMSDRERVYQIASIVTRTAAKRVFLVGACARSGRPVP